MSNLERFIREHLSRCASYQTHDPDDIAEYLARMINARYDVIEKSATLESELL